MTVDENAPAATSERAGKTYDFCAEGCRAAFERDPESYLPRIRKRSILARLNPFGR
jgi:YHS domain-containing protein